MTTSFDSRIARTSRAWRIALISAVLAGCANDRPCANDARTIDHGVYGEVMYMADDGSRTPLYEVPLTVMGTGQAQDPATETNEDGFFEIALPIEQHEFALCTGFAGAGCQSFFLSDYVRLDLVVFSGQVSWDPGGDRQCE